MNFDKTYHLNANALYISLRNEHKDNDDVDYGALFLHTPVQGNEYEKLSSESDKRIAALMTEQEEYMNQKNILWNEENTVDYETAIEALCDCQKMIDDGYAKEHGVEDEHINWCEHCGKPFLEGLMVGKEHVACSDQCMNFMIAEQYGVEISEADNVFSILTLDNNPWYFSSEYI